MTEIKLCGITREEDIHLINALKPEYIGFVFWPKSKRYVSKEQAARLKKGLDASIKRVGVFVDADFPYVVNLLEEGIIDIAQLHGQEDDDYILRLREKTKKPVIKAYIVKSMEDIESANESKADYVLMDSGKGSGITCNWQLLQFMTRPYFLAGGLGTSNIIEAIENLTPYAVDVSSGIETDGKKDADKMRTFVKLVRMKNQMKDIYS